MDANSNKSSSLRSRNTDGNSCSSLSSFANDTPKKKKKTDRMVYSIDKSEYEWSEKKTKKKSIKIEKSQSISSQKKFEDYLSDNLSDDTSSFQDFIGKSLKRTKDWTLNKRNVCESPFKQAQVKNWTDNFYSNLLDWNHENLIFAATDKEILQYTLSSFDTNQTTTYVWPWIKGGKINSIKCSPTQKYTAAAYDNGSLQIYDYHQQKSLRMNIIHSARITALDWNQRSILTGSKDRTIRMCDQRTFKESIHLIQVHRQEVLGIKRCGDLIASGGNDNLVAIYDVRKSEHLLHSYEHSAAVKSLAWTEGNKMLLSGGGTSDKMIKFWSHKGMKVVKQIQTGSQICNLIVSRNTKEFVSCQGFSQNQIVLWDFEGNRLKILHGKHSARVLYSALSPSGEYLATGAGDTSLFIWKMFPGERKNRFVEASDLR